MGTQAVPANVSLQQDTMVGDSPELRDRFITCRDCGRPFCWTVGQQEFFQERDLQPPKACRDCRAARKALKLAS